MPEDLILKAVLEQVKSYREEDFSYPAEAAAMYMNNTAHNICVDYDIASWKEQLEDPEVLLSWLETGIDTARQFIGYAAVMVDALGISEEELLHLEDENADFPFIPESWDRETKAAILKKHIESAENSRDMYKDFCTRTEEGSSNNITWNECIQEQESRIRKYTERLKRIQDAG